MDAEPSDDAVREVLVSALRFVSKITAHIPVFFRDDDPSIVKHAISLEMRRKLPQGVTYSVLLILLRLTQFADEAAEAYEEDRQARYERPENHMDFTIREIWRSWNHTVQQEYSRAMSWREVEWNPYDDLYESLKSLTRYIGKQHFGIKVGK